MSEVRVLGLRELAVGGKRAVKAGETEVLLVRLAGGGPAEGVVAVEAKCPHAGAPLEQGAVCNGRLVCPWHMGEFALPGGELVEPPPLRDLKRYPVRVEAGEIFVDSEPLPGRAMEGEGGGEASAGAEERVPVLLVGLGAAGAAAAVTLRQEGFRGRVVAVEPVASEPVDRTALTKTALGGKTAADKALGGFAGVSVERATDAVVELSAARGEVRLGSGERIRFGSALLGTGSVPRRLEVPGGERARTIRHAADVAGILRELEGRERVVVVGTSFVAMEAASALVGSGKKVTVVGRERVPFAGKFGEAAGQAVLQLHRSKGTEFRLGVEVLRVEEGAVVVREGEDGAEERVEAEVVIAGVGVEPALGFAHDLPLAERGGGVAVDAGLRAAGRVWVAGDVANVDGVRIEHWRLAEQHGRVAARAMLGEDGARYEGVPFFWTAHFGKRLGYLGQAREWDRIETEGDVAGLEFVSFYVVGNAVKAVLGCGRDTAMATLAEVMRGEAVTVEAARAAIG